MLRKLNGILDPSKNKEYQLGYPGIHKNNLYDVEWNYTGVIENEMFGVSVEGHQLTNGIMAKWNTLDGN